MCIANISLCSSKKSNYNMKDYSDSAILKLHLLDPSYIYVATLRVYVCMYVCMYACM